MYNVAPPSDVNVGLDSPQELVRYLRTMFTIVKLELCEPQLNAIVNGGLTLIIVLTKQ